MLEIIQIGHPILRQKARPLSKEEILSAPIQELIGDMHEMMNKAPGVGLAAPQIGLSIQLIVIEDSQELQNKYLTKAQLAERQRKPIPFQVIINPELKIINADQIEFFEGCLSFKNITSIVPRALEVEVNCLDERGEPKTMRAEGWFARILQHEIDHLNGIICVDHSSTKSLSSMQAYQEFWADKNIADVKKLLDI